MLSCHSDLRVPQIVKALNKNKKTISYQFVPKTLEGNSKKCAYWLVPISCVKEVQRVLYEENIFPLKCSQRNSGEIPQQTMKMMTRELRALDEEEEEQRDFEVGLRRIPVRTREKMYAFQIEGVKFGLSKRGRVMIADQMGVGKTLQAIALMCCYHKREGPCLIVAPASMRTVWANELERWIPDIAPEDIVVVEGSTAKWDLENLGKAYATSNDDVDHDDKSRNGEYKGKRKIAVSSYHMLNNLKNTFLDINWGTIICDESHVMSTAVVGTEGAYTQVAVQLLKTKSKRAILCTGTPSLVKPFDIYNQLDGLRPKMFGTKEEFGVNYCKLVLAQTSKGNKFWKSLGGRRLNELHTLLKHTVMIRRLKCEVMDQLPPKRRQVIHLDISKEFEHWMKERTRRFLLLREQQEIIINKAEKNDEHIFIHSDVDEDDEEPVVVARRVSPRTLNADQFEEIDEEKDDMNIVTDTDSEAQAIGKLKVKKAIKFLEDSILIDNSQQVVVFGHHHSVLDEIYASLQKILRIDEIICVDGRTDAIERQERMDRFHGGKSQGYDEDGKTPLPAKVRVAIFGITIAVGIDLSCASIVCFFELPQKPGDLLQAEDRAWRRERNGKNTKTCVNIYYCVAKADGCPFDDNRWQRLALQIEKNTMMTDGEEERDGRENLNVDKTGSISLLEAPAILFNEDTEKQTQHNPNDETQTLTQATASTQKTPFTQSAPKKPLGSSEKRKLKASFFTEPERVPIWFVVSEHTDRVHLHDMRLLPNETRLNCSVKQVDVLVAWEKLTKFLERHYRSSSSSPSLNDGNIKEEENVIVDNNKNDENEINVKTMSVALREKTKEILSNFVLPDALINDCDALNCCKYFVEEWNCLLSRDKNVILKSRTPVQCGGVAQLLSDLNSTRRDEGHNSLLATKERSTTRHGTGIKLGTIPKEALSRTLMTRKGKYGFEMREQFFLPRSLGKQQHSVLCDCCCKPMAFNEEKLKNPNQPLILHDLFCSKECFENHIQSKSSSSLRMAVFDRDRGVCEKCHLDCHALVSRIKCLKPHQRIPIVEQLAPRFTRAQKDKLARDAYEGSAWEADHILAVKDGGGECTIENMRTLCRKCHAENTKAQHKRWAWENRAKKDKSQRTLQFKPSENKKRNKKTMKNDLNPIMMSLSSPTKSQSESREFFEEDVYGQNICSFDIDMEQVFGENDDEEALAEIDELFRDFNPDDLNLEEDLDVNDIDIEDDDDDERERDNSKSKRFKALTVFNTLQEMLDDTQDDRDVLN